MKEVYITIHSKVGTSPNTYLFQARYVDIRQNMIYFPGLEVGSLQPLPGDEHHFVHDGFRTSIKISSQILISII